MTDPKKKATQELLDRLAASGSLLRKQRLASRLPKPPAAPKPDPKNEPSPAEIEEMYSHLT